VVDFPKALVAGGISGESQQILDFLDIHTSIMVSTAKGLMCKVTVIALEVQVVIFELLSPATQWQVYIQNKG